MVVGGWAIEVERNIKANAISELQQVVDVPFILYIETHLSASKWRFPFFSARNGLVCIVPSKLVGFIRHKCLYAIVAILSGKSLSKGILHVIEFVVRTKGYVMIS